MTSVPLRPRSLLALGALVMVIGVGFAAYTQHVWEDYYITFRASKNLAAGEGLVFNPGERVHTFTSPLGVLLPALTSWLAGPEGDRLALWGFRVISLLALAGGAVFLARSAHRMGMVAMVAWSAGLLLAMDGKTLDFSINGMETGLWVLFLAYAIWAQLASKLDWRHLGGAWAGLMWTRPDCFIHIALMGVGHLIFLGGEIVGGRRALVQIWIKAGLLTTCLYLPWFAWAWTYYGTPIPHTVAAKSGLAREMGIWDQLILAAKMPFAALGFHNSMGASFLPAYYQFGGWGNWPILLAKVVSGFAGLIWLLPRVSRATRWVSFVYAGIHAYLTLIPYYFFPWYLPAAMPFAVLAVLGVARDWASNRSVVGSTRWSMGVATLALLGSGMFTGLIAQQMRAQQEIIEDGNRRRIGEFLRQHAQPDNTVMMEPLGYIGYFSGLRTYDYPGMSSPEMVAARAVVGDDWKDLINHLQPDWLALRPQEVGRLHQNTDWHLNQAYELVATFDRSEDVAKLHLPGRGYLEHDAVFWLLRRTSREKLVHDDWQAEGDQLPVFHERPWGGRIDFHADAELLFKIPPGTQKINLQFGTHEFPAEIREELQDGVRVALAVRDRPHIHPLNSFYVVMKPEGEIIPLVFELPSGLSADAELRISVSRRVWRDQDFCYVFLPGFER